MRTAYNGGRSSNNRSALKTRQFEARYPRLYGPKVASGVPYFRAQESIAYTQSNHEIVQKEGAEIITVWVIGRNERLRLSETLFQSGQMQGESH